VSASPPVWSENRRAIPCALVICHEGRSRSQRFWCRRPIVIEDAFAYWQMSVPAIRPMLRETVRENWVHWSSREDY